jgi:hypothetical protein
MTLVALSSERGRYKKAGEGRERVIVKAALKEALMMQSTRGRTNDQRQRKGVDWSTCRCHWIGGHRRLRKSERWQRVDKERDSRMQAYTRWAVRVRERRKRRERRTDDKELYRERERERKTIQRDDRQRQRKRC